MLSECDLGGAQDHADDLRAKWISDLSDDDLAEIEREHWPNILRLHKERLSERKTREEEKVKP